MKNKLQCIVRCIVYAVIVMLVCSAYPATLSADDDIHETKEIYKKKIQENPLDPLVYKDYALFLMEVREFPNAIVQWKKHKAALLDRDIIGIMTDLEKYMADLESVKKIRDYIELVKKNKRVAESDKLQLIDEARNKVKELDSTETLNGRLDSLSGLMENKLHDAEKNISQLSYQRIIQLAKAYYYIGLSCFNESYQGCLSMECDREEFITMGIGHLEKSIALNPADPEAYKVMAFLFREKIRVDPLNKEEYEKKYRRWMERHELVKGPVE